MGEEFRLFGPPGTGKTSTLGNQVRKWASEYGSDEVMVASFTRAAAAEIASRHLPIAPRQVGTLHSFALRSLDGDTGEVADNFVGEFNEAHPAYTRSKHSVDLDDPAGSFVAGGELPGDQLAERHEILRARMVPEDHWPDSVRGYARAWDGWKAETSRLDFTDMIDLALHNTTSPPGAPSVACFDEVQDFTPLELELVRHWSRRMDRSLLAGDDDQVLYGFKGATPDAFLSPPVDAAHKRVLRQSWRVPSAIHAVAQRWVERLTQREPKEYAPRKGDPGVVRDMHYTCHYKNPTPVIYDALAQVEAGRTVMILTTCAFLLQPTLNTLRHDGIPFHNPYRLKRPSWNPIKPTTGKRKSSVERLLAYLRPDGDTWGDEARWYTEADVKAWMVALDGRGLLRRGAKRAVERWTDLGARIDDEAFADLWLPECLEEALTATARADIDWFADHLTSAASSPLQFPLRVARRRGGAALRETPKLIVGTIHSVKGAEADVVYLYPELSRAGWRQSVGQFTERDTIVRQMYVGMTRAREELVFCANATPLSVPPNSMMYGLG